MSTARFHITVFNSHTRKSVYLYLDQRVDFAPTVGQHFVVGPWKEQPIEAVVLNPNDERLDVWVQKAWFTGRVEELVGWLKERGWAEDQPTNKTRGKSARHAPSGGWR